MFSIETGPVPAMIIAAVLVVAFIFGIVIYFRKQEKARKKEE